MYTRVFNRFLTLVSFFFITEAGLRSSPIEWNYDHGNIEVYPNQKAVSFKFVGINNSSSLVKIKEIKASCGCIALIQDGVEQLKPGGKIGITAELNPSNQLSTTRNVSILVDTYDSIDTLKLQVTVIKAITATPKLLYWENNEQKKDKAIEVALNKDLNINIHNIAYNVDEIQLLVEKQIDGKDIRVHITPKQNNGPFLSQITIHAFDDKGQEFKENLYAVISK